ncbi:9015_t:CDS:2 [Ambispora gerdemannii]|uniref:9015_t:CDS:1 n=1 Tax=Ambispora gerdemannii TaxID=144530 RepID=A0A9N8WAL4_9GLOM|nr:9015_t:CDS:2 [Ambispora gerdemannii]
MNNKNHNKLANENPTNSTNTTSIPRSDHNITTTTNPWTSTITPPLANTLLAVYVRIRRKKHRQQLLSSAISVAEGGISAPETGMSESYQNQQPTSTPSPTPLPPPQPLPSPPSPLSTIDSFSTRGSGSLSSPRYQVSTLQIEPMTRRVTLNLGERGRNIVLRNTDGSGTDHVVNVISIQEEDENESDGLSSSFKKKVMFWRGP